MDVTDEILCRGDKHEGRVECRKATACAYGENKNLKVSVKGDKIYINSALWNGKEHAIEMNGRIYIPLSLVQELYPNVSTNALENEISIYVP